MDVLRAWVHGMPLERFVHAVRESGNPNISCWYEPGDTTFTFANGQIGKAKYKLAI